MEEIQDVLITRCTFRLSLYGLAVLREGVGKRIPYIVACVDHLHGNVLGDDAFHHFVDGALLVQSYGAFAVVGLQLVAQVPMGQQDHILREENLSAFVGDAAHIDVVGGDINVRFARGIALFTQYVSRNARGEHVAQSCVGPCFAVVA